MAKSGITLSALEEDILTLLKSKSAYGLEIIEAIAHLSEGQRAVLQGTMYPILKRLEEEQFVQTRWGEEAVGARRKYYQLTALGAVALKEKHDYRARLESWGRSWS